MKQWSERRLREGIGLRGYAVTGSGRVLGRGLLGLFGFLFLVVTISLTGCDRNEREVVVYTALDNVFSREILTEFERETGIRVKPVFDTEATKTTGLVERIRREQKAPRCDVFWNNELLRTIRLGEEGLLEAYDSPNRHDIPEQFKDPLWTGFAARARVVAFDPKKYEANSSSLPQSHEDVASARFHGRVALADPRFGTTGTHLAILHATFGKEFLESWLTKLRDHGVVLVSGNATSRDRVVSGDIDFGWTDTDDVEVARRRDASIAPHFFPGETVVIPNSVAIVRGCPHPAEAQALVDFLLTRVIEERLAASSSRQIPVRENVPVPPTGLRLSDLDPLEVDYRKAAAVLPEALQIARDTLGR